MDEEAIKAEIIEGLKQVNENYVLNSFSCAQVGRSVDVLFTFKDGDSETEVELKWD